MDDDRREILRSINDPDYIVNITCDYDYIPSVVEYIDSFGSFGITFVAMGTFIMAATLCLTVDASYTIMCTKESKSWKRNVLIIIFVYPVASLCSLVALSVPRSQLLSEAITQIYLTIVLYRLYLLLIDVGLRETKKSPPMRLQVGPCCCWPCLPFPSLEMNDTNLSWLQIIVLQLPIVQTLIYCAFAFMSEENPMFVRTYGIFLQPLIVTSILLGLYGLNITMMSLQEINSDSSLRHKTVVVQLVLLFSKLQGFIVKNLPTTGLFPCNPPITPQTYANFTYNALMIIEMLFLCYAARLVYADRDENGNDGTVQTRENNSTTNDVEVGARLGDGKQSEVIGNRRADE